MSALVVRGARLVEPDGGASSPVDVTVRAGRVESVTPAAGTYSRPVDKPSAPSSRAAVSRASIRSSSGGSAVRAAAPRTAYRIVPCGAR